MWYRNFLVVVFLGILGTKASELRDENQPVSTVLFSAGATASISVYSPQITLPLQKNNRVPSPHNIPSHSPLLPHKKHCIVSPLGWGQDDSSQILAAVEQCGTNGIITLPAPFVYTISRRMYMNLVNSRIEIFGTLSFTPDLLYWITESHRIEFQNQSTAWIVEGRNFQITGGGWQQGGIDGNGQAWMTRSGGASNQYGRPISLSIYNSSNVTITDFSVRQAQFWIFYIQDSSNIQLKGIYMNSTNTDPAGNASNYAINTDGLDTLRVNNLLAENWIFRGGDDCIALKGNSTNMIFRNLTCSGGGIAFGSIGQYPGSPDYITNVTALDVTVSQNFNPLLGGSVPAAGAYFKTWVGVAAGTPPQGGGGGTGLVSKINVRRLTVHNTTKAVYINQCYYKVPSQAADCDTSTLSFKNLDFREIEGTVSGNVGIALNCSTEATCRNFRVQNIDLESTSTNSSVEMTCVNIKGMKGAQCNETLPARD